jgi:diguanylate cyclase (GGDEF)-like protein
MQMLSGKTPKATSVNIAALSLAFVTFIAFVFIFEIFIRSESEKIEATRRSEAISYGSMLRSQVDRELNALLFISGGLASYLNVYHQDLEPEKIQAILADLYSRSKHVRNLGIAIGYRITYVHPVEGNEKAIGIDYQQLPKQWPQVKQAVDTRQGVLAGPLDLVQGGKGLIYRYPVYIQGEYWGILSTVINTGPFLHAAFGNLSSTDHDFAVRTKESSGQPGIAFYGDPGLFDNPRAILMESEVPNGKWEWAILRKSDDVSPIVLIMRSMGLAISLLLGSVVYFFMHERMQLTAHALYDSLTGLANRRLLQDRMLQALAQAKRFGRWIAVMYIDVDHFKTLNDTYGHHFGDKLLMKVSRRLAGCIRDADTLGRVGGDEFVIVLEEIGQPQDARLVAENILAAFKEPMVVMDKDTLVNLSIGIAIYQLGDNISANDLLKQADIALYDAKRAGRNGYRVFGDIVESDATH